MNILKLLQILVVLFPKRIIGEWLPDDKDLKESKAIPKKNDLKISCYFENSDRTPRFLDEPRNILMDPLTRINRILIHHLGEMINSTNVQVFQSVSSSDADNTTKDIINDIRTGRFDLTATPIKIIKDEIDHIDYLAKTVTIEKKFVFRDPPHSYITNVFLLPFDKYVWYCCFGLLAIIFIITYIVMYWEWSNPWFRRENLIGKQPLSRNPVEIFLMEIGSAAQQGYESEPQSVSGRMIFGFTLISFMFLYVCFSANIVALLQSTSKNLNSLEKLLDSTISIGFQDNANESIEYLKNRSYENKRYTRFTDPSFLKIKDGVSEMRNDFFSYYGDTNKIYKHIKATFTEEEKCRLREIKLKNTYEDYWIAMRKDYPNKDLLKVGMRKIYESGLHDRELRRFTTRKPDCDIDGSSFESVGFRDFIGAPMIMGTGVGFGLLMFLCEIIWKKYFDKNKNDKPVNKDYIFEDEEGSDGESFVEDEDRFRFLEDEYRNYY